MSFSFTVPPSKTRTKTSERSMDLNCTQEIVSSQWENIDPAPDIHNLFKQFNEKFFNRKLECVQLEWSKKMYSCAGICYSSRNNLGMSCTIRLSEPLLKFRSRKELIETLLHEMIHAFCFVLGIREGNGGHGPNFVKMMTSINQRAGTNITVYHNFHDEVNLYKVHWWRCNGPCVNRAPYYGFVKRSYNRAPAKTDSWWAAHQSSCGGQFIKVKEPESKRKKSEGKENKSGKKATVPKTPPPKTADIRKFFSPTVGSSSQTQPFKSPQAVPNKTKETGNIVQFKDLGDSDSDSSRSSDTPIQLFKGTGYVLGGSTPTTRGGRSRLLDKFDIKIVSQKPDADSIPQAPRNIKQELEKDFDSEDIIMIDDEFDDTFETPAVVNQDTPLIDQYFNVDDFVDLTEIDFGIVGSPTDSGISSHNSSNTSRLVIKEETEGFTKYAQDSSNSSESAKNNNLKKRHLSDENKSALQYLIDCGYSEEDALKFLEDEEKEKDSSSAKKRRISEPAQEVILIESDLVDCPSCNKKFTESSINQHLDDCLNAITEEPVAGTSGLNRKTGPGTVSCPICKKKVGESEINAHLDTCLF